MNIKNIILTGLLALTATACNDWLDVDPKSQIKEEDHFSREGGYKDQLTGVYTAMSASELYGLNLGIGFAEVLSHSYDVDANGKWRYANEFNYTESTSEATITEIWNASYNAIANLNLVIENIEQADRGIFSENHYDIYRGEAYGLRAFLHFDLMRLFAQAPQTDANANGVPYVTSYATSVTPQRTVAETMQLIIADLLTARKSLESDSLKISYSPYTHRSSRVPAFNYYAATLTLARAYLWMGDTQNALTYAKEIVDLIESDPYSTPFYWIHYTNMQSTNRNELDMTFSTEHVFRLTISDWEDVANYYFKSQAGSAALTPNEQTAQDIYEVATGHGNDYRYLKAYEQDGDKRFLCKFWHVEGGYYNDVYPLLRLSEAYYIAAEALRDTDPAQAIQLLQTVRDNRNLDLLPLDESLRGDDLQNEIYKEYRKEFVGEGGQLFFYHKRRGETSIKGSSVVAGKGVYVLPIPTSDQEFGGYSN